MAKRKIKKTISMNEKDFSTLGILGALQNNEDISFEQKAAVYVILEDTEKKIKENLEELKVFKSLVSNKLKTIPYNDHIKDMVKRGVLTSESETPVIEITRKDGSIYAASFTGKTGEVFEIDKTLSLEENLKFLDAKYKVVSTTLDKDRIKSELKDGTLPAAISMYCNVISTDTTNIKITCIKEPDKKEE